MAETVVMTLTEFLLARIAEDETAIARRQAAVDETNDAFPDTPAELCDCIGIVDGAHDWNCPARALAECEAKRRIVALHDNRYGLGDCASCAQGWQDLTTGEEGHSPDIYPCLTLRNLALPYAAHEDYREAWKP